MIQIDRYRGRCLRSLGAWLLLLPLLLVQSGASAAGEPTLTLTPNRVSCTTPMIARGEGFMPGSEIVISTGDIDDVPTSIFLSYLGPYPVALDGTFEAEIPGGFGIYECFGGPLGRDGAPYQFTASTVVDDGAEEQGESPFGLPAASASFTFAVDPDDPRVTLTPDHGTGCEEVTIQGENFLPGTSVFVTAGGLGGHAFAQVTSKDYPLVREDGTFDAVLEYFSDIVGCSAGSLPRDGSQYIVGATTGRPKSSDDPGPDPQAATVFTVTLSPAERFQQTWARTDAAIANSQASRTWIWGPEPLTEVFQEPYADSPNGMRAVQYFDKSRMEINDPDGDRSSPWHVTNGLLVVEMVEGKFQTSDTQFDESPDPANIAIAGDPGSASPTYAEINQLGLMAEPARELDTVIDEYISTGQAEIGSYDGYAAYGLTASRYVPETRHAIASVFWEFMNSEIAYTPQLNYSYMIPLFEDPFYATGYPITEAYWTTTLLQGQPADILWQCFERRCLTWTPVNDEGWQVEAGNVGQHYFQWRYPEGVTAR